MTVNPVNPNAPLSPVPPRPQSTGCVKYGLIGCGILCAIIAIIVVSVIAVAFGAIKSTDAYKQARTRATTDPRVIAALGAPVKAGFFVMGNVKVENRTGTAIINFPISGSKEKACVRVEATLDAEGWHYSVLQVDREHGPPINLIEQ